MVRQRCSDAPSLVPHETSLATWPDSTAESSEIPIFQEVNPLKATEPKSFSSTWIILNPNRTHILYTVYTMYIQVHSYLGLSENRVYSQ